MPAPTLHTKLLPWAKQPMLQKTKTLGEQELPCTNADRSRSCPEQGSAVGGETGQNGSHPALQTGMDSIFTQSMEPPGTEAPFPCASGSRCVRNNTYDAHGLLVSSEHRSTVSVTLSSGVSGLVGAAHTAWHREHPTARSASRRNEK